MHPEAGFLVLRDCDLLIVETRNLLLRVADDLRETRVTTQVLAFERGVDDAHCGLLEGCAVALLAVAQLHLRLLALGDVFNDAAHLHQLAPAIELQPAQPMNPAHSMIFMANNAVFFIEIQSLPDNFFREIGGHHGAIISMNQGHPSCSVSLHALQVVIRTSFTSRNRVIDFELGVKGCRGGLWVCGISEWSLWFELAEARA